MLNIPESVKTLFKTDGTRKNFRVQFPNGEYPDITNENIVRESLHFTESICSQDVFRFGLAEASVLEFETVNVGNMYGMTINAFIEIDVSSLSAEEINDIEAGSWDGALVDLSSSDIGYSFYRVPLGVFRVQDCPRNHETMTHRQVTAYSVTALTGLTNLPYDGPAPQIEVGFNGMIAIDTGEGLTEIQSRNVSTTTTTYSFGNGMDENGNIWSMMLLKGSHDSPSSALWSETYVYSSGNSASWGDLFYVDSNYTEAKLSAFRKSIADALDTAGFDLTYERNSGKVYRTNREFLDKRSSFRLPFVTYERVAYLWPDLDPDEPVRTNVCWSKIYRNINPNKYVPIVRAEDDAAFRFVDPPEQSQIRTWMSYIDAINEWPNPGYNPHSMRGMPQIAEGDTIFLRLKHGLETIDIDLPTPAGGLKVNSIRRFTVDDKGTILTINADGEIPNSGGGSNPIQAWFTYTDRSVLRSYYVSWLETHGELFRAGRDGNGKSVSLDSGQAVSILPSEYSEAWWDEYDVDSVGTVEVTYNDTNDGLMTTRVKIGSGSSVYMLTDNEALTEFLTMSYTELSNMLNGNFAQNASKINFTPFELQAVGMPWLEAGDPVEIETQTGETVKSFIMRRELSGVQLLTDEIEAKGGEIAEEATVWLV